MRSVNKTNEVSQDADLRQRNKKPSELTASDLKEMTDSELAEVCRNTECSIEINKKMIEIRQPADGNICVASPYDPQFVSAARLLGGKWDSYGKAWHFDAADRPLVEEKLTEIYGWRPPVYGERTVTVRVTLGDDGLSPLTGPIVIGGVELSSAWGRDSGAKLGNGVVVIKGSAESGGSLKNWRTKFGTNIVLEVRHLPESAASAIVDQCRDMDRVISAQIIDTTRQDRDAPIAQQKALRSN